MAEQPTLTNKLVHIGLIVDNIEEKAKDWAEVLGLPVPEIIVTDPVEIAHTEYDGKRSPARAKLTSFRGMGDFTIELIEPIGEPSMWQDQLNEHGGGLHHLALVEENLQEKLEMLASKGMAVKQKGDFTGGRYVYVDARDRLGVILEIMERDG